MLFIQMPGSLLVVYFQAVLNHKSWTTWLPYVCTAVQQGILIALWFWFRCVLRKKQKPEIMDDDEDNNTTVNFYVEPSEEVVGAGVLSTNDDLVSDASESEGSAVYFSDVEEGMKVPMRRQGSPRKRGGSSGSSAFGFGSENTPRGRWGELMGRGRAVGGGGSGSGGSGSGNATGTGKGGIVSPIGSIN
jgi:hypothetical protein